MSEGTRVAEERMSEIREMGLDEVLGLMARPHVTEVVGPSGGSYRVKTEAFWDMEPFESDLFITATVRGRGSRFLQRHNLSEVRGPDGEVFPYEDGAAVRSAWIENLACAGCLLSPMVLLAPFALTVKYLASKL